jgi:hypothetical protein
MMEYMFFVLQSPYSFENLILEPDETPKGELLAAISGLMHLLKVCKQANSRSMDQHHHDRSETSYIAKEKYTTSNLHTKRPIRLLVAGTLGASQVQWANTFTSNPVYLHYP